MKDKRDLTRPGPFCQSKFDFIYLPIYVVTNQDIQLGLTATLKVSVAYFHGCQRQKIEKTGFRHQNKQLWKENRIQ